MCPHVGDDGAVLEYGGGRKEDESFLECGGGEGVESVSESVEREGGGWDGWVRCFGCAGS